MPMTANNPFGEGFLPGQARSKETAATKAYAHRWGDHPAVGGPPKVIKRRLPESFGQPPKSMTA